jgi:DNA (cytosine-5)-methyltransferase 1
MLRLLFCLKEADVSYEYDYTLAPCSICLGEIGPNGECFCEMPPGPIRSGLKIGELCAGYNGLGMAVEEVFGATPAWFSEFDAAPSKILSHHYPDVPNYGDMTKIDWAAIEPVDIISGGTPCQDLSAAGKRKGMTEGTRSNLWVQMREAIAIQKPKYVVWENVRGAYSASADSELEQCAGCMGDPADRGVVLRALGRVLGDLADLGFHIQWRGLRAADVGACHGRFRVFVLAAHPGRIGGREGNLPARIGTTSLDRSTVPHESDPGRVRPERQDVADAYNLGYQRGWEARGRRLGLADSGEPAPYTNGRDDDGRLRDALGSEEWREAIAGRGEGLSPASEPASIGGRKGRSEHAGVEGRSDAIERGASTNWGDYEPAIRRWEAVMGRRAPAPTEPTGRNGGHRLSPRFTEWMMGLPDGWVTDPAIGISRNEQLKACGNGVVPQQAMAALRDMLAAFNSQELKEAS